MSAYLHEKIFNELNLTINKENGLTAEEMAKMFRTKVTNIYSSISQTLKKKVNIQKENSNRGFVYKIVGFYDKNHFMSNGQKEILNIIKKQKYSLTKDILDNSKNSYSNVYINLNILITKKYINKNSDGYYYLINNNEDINNTKQISVIPSIVQDIIGIKDIGKDGDKTINIHDKKLIAALNRVQRDILNKHLQARDYHEGAALMLLQSCQNILKMEENVPCLQ